jgi:DNA repair protein RadC
MSTTTFYPRDPELVARSIRVLASERVAKRLIRLSGGSAATLLGMAQVTSGREWDRLRAAMDLQQQALLETASQGSVLGSPAQVKEFLRSRLGSLPHEVFCILFLDTRHRILAMRELFRGTIDGASVHPREVIHEALMNRAAAVLLVHNHPSGVSEPSQADEMITRRLKEALALIDIRVLDHLIVCGSDCTSMAERGLV